MKRPFILQILQNSALFAPRTSILGLGLLVALGAGASAQPDGRDANGPDDRGPQRRAPHNRNPRGNDDERHNDRRDDEFRGDRPPPDDGPPFGGPPRGPRPLPRHELGHLWHDLGDLQTGKTPLSKAQAARVVALTLPWTRKAQISEAQAQILARQIGDVLTPGQKTALLPPRPRFEDQRGGDFGPPPREGERPERDDFGPPRDGKRDEARRGPRRPFLEDGFRGGPDDGPHHGPPRDRPPFGGPDEPFGRGPQPRGPRNAAERKFFENLNPLYPPTGYADWKNLPAPVQKDVARHYREFRATLETLSRQSRH